MGRCSRLVEVRLDAPWERLKESAGRVETDRNEGYEEHGVVLG
jgi:hypothetical protein